MWRGVVANLQKSRERGQKNFYLCLLLFSPGHAPVYYCHIAQNSRDFAQVVSLCKRAVLLVKNRVLDKHHQKLFEKSFIKSA